MFKLFRPPAGTFNTTNIVRSVSLFSTIFGSATKMDTPSVRKYTPTNPDGPFPYSTQDLTPMDPGNDASFYGPPRFVTHIDDNAIVNLKQYYDKELPRKGVILDFCSSWISHYPPDIFNRARRREEHISKRESSAKTSTDGGSDTASSSSVTQNDLTILGTGMNEAELKANPVLLHYSIQDLNTDPDLHLPAEKSLALDASTCVVSIDYLTNPVDVLKSVHRQTNQGGRVHLVISNRCFPTKVVGRWLRISEEQRLEMVGDYLWWAGWRDIEIVDVVRGGFMTDPLWVVRGRKVDG